jgi:hypothetical protein
VNATLHHVGFVVHDVEKTAQDLADSLGIGPWGVSTIEPATTTVRGRDVPFTFRIAIAPVGDSHYELVAPLTGDSLYVEHLERHGEGFHHTCFTYPTHEALLETKAQLTRQGRELVQSGAFGDAGEFCYFEIRRAGLDPRAALAGRVRAAREDDRLTGTRLP